MKYWGRKSDEKQGHYW